MYDNVLSARTRVLTLQQSYDAVAREYGDRLATELASKPLDRHLLHRFAEAVGRSPVADVGCGPGHVARYLHDRGVTVTGYDISPGMIAEARRRHPGLTFQVGEMTQIEVTDGTYQGIVAFYSLIHWRVPELGAPLRELRRMLAPGGLLLVAFHLGRGTLHLDELFGVAVSLDVRLFLTGEMVRALRRQRLHVLERIERDPYEGAEYPSRRCYLLARAE